MGFILGRTIRLELGGRPILVEESVIPGPYTEATQQDWPATATGKEPAMDDEVTITKAEYLRLLEASLELEQLRDAGVDNWPGRDHVDWGQIQDTMAGARAVLGVAE